MRFEDLNFSQEILKGIKAMGFEEMSPIQSQAIPVLLEGKDVIGQAQQEREKLHPLGFQYWRGRTLLISHCKLWCYAQQENCVFR